MAMQKSLYGWTLLCFLLLVLPFSGQSESNVYPYNQDEQSPEYWNNQARETLRLAEQRQPIIGKAKNVILFLGDGMGISTLTAARIRKGQTEGRSGEEGALNFEKFDNVALIKTYNVDRQVPDSAGTATAYLTGVKANFETIGVNARVNSSETNCDLIQSNAVHSIMESARLAGKSIGIVTTTRITHATPAASYAHVAHRDWENDFAMPEQTRAGGCKDIAYQLINQEPGNSFQVIFGGGRRNFLSRPDNENQTNPAAFRTDGINLIEQWKSKRAASGLTNDQYAYIETKDQLLTLDEKRTKYVLGLFNDDHVAYQAELLANPTNPSLSEMSTKAVQILSQNPAGFVLLVEGGRIDHAHHWNMGVMAVEETVQFDKAIGQTLQLVDKKDTLVAVTADHSHTFVINGYPRRGNNIYGTTGYTESDTSKYFTTLLYGNGPGHVENRPDAAHQDTTSANYVNFAGIKEKDSHHGGEDVALYSQGPMAHLYFGLKEQNFIPHVMQYATCIGLYENEPHCSTSTRGGKFPNRYSAEIGIESSGELQSSTGATHEKAAN